MPNLDTFFFLSSVGMYVISINADYSWLVLVEIICKMKMIPNGNKLIGKDMQEMQ